MERHLVERSVESCQESCGTILDRAIQTMNDLRLSSDEEILSIYEEDLVHEAAAPAASTSGICEISTDNHAQSANGAEPSVEENASLSAASMEKSECVELLLQEMSRATCLQDARIRATRLLEAFENVVASRSEIADELKEMRIHRLFVQKQILKRGAAIQHRRLLGYEDTLRELQTAKQLLAQHQAQFRSIELENYALSWHLRKARERMSIPRQFDPFQF